MPPPCEDRIDLWLAPADEIRDERLLARYRRLLCPVETERWGRFRHAEDRHLFLVTRALVRTVLSRYADMAPDAWRFSYDRHGRPHIENRNVGAGSISFSISRCRGNALIAVTGAHAIGADIERSGQRLPDPDFAQGFLSRGEVETLRALPESERADGLLRFWTLKEAYLKARGMGLGIAPDQCEFALLPCARVAFRPDARLRDHASCWRFWSLRCHAPSEGGELIALCASAEPAARQRLTARLVVPYASERPLVCRIEHGS